jgi:DNA-binding NtrC family response regulator
MSKSFSPKFQTRSVSQEHYPVANFGEASMSRPPMEISNKSIVDEGQAPKTANGGEAVGGASNDEPIAPLRSVRAQVEIKAILAALQRTGWNRKQAARLLKISYRGLLYKIRRHNITAA